MQRMIAVEQAEKWAEEIVVTWALAKIVERDYTNNYLFDLQDGSRIVIRPDTGEAWIWRRPSKQYIWAPCSTQFIGVFSMQESSNV